MNSITSEVNVTPQFASFAFLVRCLFLFPIIDNDGRALAGEIAEAEADLARAFGGYTELGTARGAWIGDGGKLFRDDTRVFCVLLPESDVPRLQGILRSFKARTLQEAIYLEITHDVRACFV